MILGRSGRYREAIETFRRLEEIAPDEPMVHTNLSLYFMKVGDIEAAERHKTVYRPWGRYSVLEDADDCKVRRLVVKPTWRDYQPAGNEKVLEIDPGMAFGTGTHPTTALCIRMI